MGCRIPWFDSKRTHTLPDCESPSQYKAFQNWTRIYASLDSTPASRQTGCQWSCEHAKFELMHMTDLWISPKYGPGSLRLAFVLNKGHFLKNEQYTIYDGTSFIADVGGFLGLLLGYSLFSLVQVLSKYLPKKQLNLCNRK